MPSSWSVADLRSGTVPNLVAVYADESCLGREVRFHRVMVVEMIARQVREHTRGKRHTFNATLFERMGRHLHRDDAHSRFCEIGEQTLQFDGTGCGQPAPARQRGSLRSKEHAKRADGCSTTFGVVEQMTK